MRRYWQACGGENRPAPPADVRNATNRAAHPRCPDAQAGPPCWSVARADEAGCAAGMEARDALLPMQWAAGFSRVSVRSVLILSSTLVARLTENVGMGACAKLPLQGLVEPAVIDPEPAVFRTV